MRCTVWIIFNALYCRWNAIFVTTEIHQTVMLLMTTTNMTRGNTSIIITTTSLRFFLEQWCVRSAFMKLLVDYADDETTASRSRFAFNNCHDAPLFYSALLVKSISWPG